MRFLSLAAAIALALPSAMPVDARSARPVAEGALRGDARAIHILSFDEPAAPLFRGFQAKDGRRPALAPVSIAVTGQAKYDPSRAEARAYLAYLGDLRAQRLAAASSLLGRDLEPGFVYQHALNGVSLELTPAEAKALSALPGVRAVTPDFERSTMTDRGPAWIKAPDVWSGAAGVTSRGEGVIVGIIDSGINPSHPSFAATAGAYTHTNPKGALLGWCATPANAGTCNNKLIGVYDFVAGGSTGTTAFTPDPDGHGTHVASTAAGNPARLALDGALVDITGVAPRANLIAYRGCGSTSDSRSCGSSAPLLASIDRAIVDRVDVINYSIGGAADNPWLSLGGQINTDEEAFLAAREAGIVVVAAAGNDGPNAGSLNSPANAPWVVGVASVTHNRGVVGDRLAASSGRGPISPLGVVKPDVAAPGVSIRAASNLGNNALELSGTSMASPHVAGAAALIKAARPAWTADQIVSALMTTARADGIVEQSGGGSTTPQDRGAGTIDVALAVNAPLAFNLQVGAFRNASEATASSLNLPSLAAANCVETCTLNRRVGLMPGVASGQYEVIAQLPAGLAMTATPSTLSLSGSAAQDVAFRFGTTAQSSLNTWTYGSVTLRRVGGGAPDVKLPVAIYLSSGTVPPLQQRSVAADRGHVDFALGEIISLPNARFASTDLAVPMARQQSLPEDPTNSDPYDNLSNGVFFLNLPVNFNDGRSRTVQVSASVVPASSPSAQDFDLFVGVDVNGNGLPERAEERCTSTSPGASESCTFTLTHSGNNVPITVWGLVQNWRASSAGASNEALLEMVAIDTLPSTRQVATGPGNLPANTNFNARLVYDDPGFLNGQSRFGFLVVDRGPGANAIRVPYKLTRNSATPAPFAMSPGVDRGVTLPAGAAHEYLYIDVPAGATQLTVTTTSAANVDLYLARVPPVDVRPEIPAIAVAPARSSANASATTASGNETVSVANPASGRWYLTPVNTSGSTASAVVRATLAGTAPGIKPGGYFNPQRGGHGLFLFPAPPVLSGLWYTYQADGTPTWHYLEGLAPGTNGHWTGALFRSAWNGSANALVQVGTATVSPTAINEFVYSYNLDGQTGSERFVNFGGGCPSLSGSPLDVSSHWFNPARAGTGYSVQLFPNDEYYAVFVYDQFGVPRFLDAQRGTGFGGANASFPLVQLSGFCPLCNRTGDPTRTPIGTFSRSFANGTFSNITLAGTFVNGVPGNWSGNEPVSALGGAAGLQGCGP